MVCFSKLVAILIVSFNGQGAMKSLTPPQPEKIPFKLEKHGDVRVDDYFWLKDRKSPKVKKHLVAENQYTEKIMAPHKKLSETLYKEMRGRIKEEDSSAPYKKGNYWYYRFTKAGQDYPTYARKFKTLESKPEVLINGTLRSKNKKYFSNTGPEISPNEKLMAFAEDTQGRRFYTIHVIDLKTKKPIISPIKNTSGNMAWANDNKHLFFSVQDPETLREFQIKRLNIKTKKVDLIYEEKDPTFSCWVSKSSDDKYLFIGSAASLTSEYQYVDADTPTQPFEIFLKRETKHEYSLDHGDQGFFVLSNKNALNNRLLLITDPRKGLDSAKELITHSDKVYLTSFLPFKNFVAVETKENANSHLKIYSTDFKEVQSITFDDSAYTVELNVNEEYETDYVRYSYQSFRMPPSIYDYDVLHHKSELKKVLEVPTYDPANYTSERIMVKSRDGKEIPVSLFYKKTTQKNKTAPLLMYGYGSYGLSMDVWFNSNVVSLVDRGFVYAIAHVRGGSELGRQWFENGRVLNKMNSFNDFIDATEGLLKLGYGDPTKVFAQGGSAGGLLMGGVINLKPSLWRGVLAQVAFVDVLTTMLDDSIPLTTSEYDQWGNPNEKQYYDYIKTYSPYDNVVDNKYPNILATTGFHDSQVQYWEPAKWVAKLRDHQKGTGLIMLKTNMDAGHGGASGRFKALKEKAFEYSFFLSLL